MMTEDDDDYVNKDSDSYFESFFLDKLYLGIKRKEMGRKLFGH